MALEFSDCDEPFVRKLNESGQIGRAVDSRRWPGMTTRSTFRAPAGERDPCCSYSARLTGLPLSTPFRCGAIGGGGGGSRGQMHPITRQRQTVSVSLL